MTVDVLVREGGVGIIIHDDDVGGGACLQHAQLHGEVLARDLGVVAEEHIGDLAPCHVGQAGVETLDAEGGLEGLHHVVGPSVRAETHGDTRAGQGQHGADTHGVGHIGLGVIHHHGARFLNNVDLGGVHMDAVAQHRLFAQDAVIHEALHGAAAVVAEGVVHIVHTLGDVDVEAGAACVGLHHPLEGLVGDGEESVTAEHGCQHGVFLLLAVGDEVGVLLNGLQALLLAVTVGDLVAEAGADAELLGALGDLEEGAGDLGIGGVVVENGGDALLDAVDVESIGAGAAALQGQLAIHGPPSAVQHLVEIGGVVAHNAEAASQSGIDMGVGVNKGGHDDAAAGINDFSIGVLGAESGLLPYLHDFRALKGHGAVFIIALALTVAGDEPSVSQQIHNGNLLQSFNFNLHPIHGDNKKCSKSP